jgi:hypothetical protein
MQAGPSFALTCSYISLAKGLGTEFASTNFTEDKTQTLPPGVAALTLCAVPAVDNSLAQARWDWEDPGSSQRH